MAKLCNVNYGYGSKDQKIGFRPNPSLGIGDRTLNGFELNKIKNKKPTIKKF